MWWYCGLWRVKLTPKEARGFTFILYKPEVATGGHQHGATNGAGRYPHRLSDAWLNLWESGSQCQEGIIILRPRTSRNDAYISIIRNSIVKKKKLNPNPSPPTHKKAKKALKVKNNQPNKHNQQQQQQQNPTTTTKITKNNNNHK